MKSAGIRELARACGLAVGTVSNALHGRGRVAAETIARVRAKAEVLGYRPNPYAAVLGQRGRPGRQGLGLAIFTVREGGVDYPPRHWTERLRRRIQEQGFRCTVCPINSAEEGARATDRLHARGVEGIFGPGLAAFLDIPHEKLARFCVVVIGRQRRLSPYHSIFHSIFDSTLEVLARVQARGYQRILPVLAPHTPPLLDDHERWAAVQVARREQGRGPILPPVMHGRGRLDIAHKVRRTRADAVVAFNDLEAVQLQAAGYRFLDDLGFAALHAKDPALVGGSSTSLAIAAAAVDIMLASLRREER